jgi:hypothetical protein
MQVPTPVHEIIHAAALAAPGDYSVIGEVVSEHLHVTPTIFTLQMIKRLIQGHGNRPKSGLSQRHSLQTP